MCAAQRHPVMDTMGSQSENRVLELRDTEGSNFGQEGAATTKGIETYSTASYHERVNQCPDFCSKLSMFGPHCVYVE
jgi:hypothetical protein